MDECLYNVSMADFWAGMVTGFGFVFGAVIAGAAFWFVLKD